MTLLDRLLARRDALLGSARFRRWAARFPPTRPLARHRARQLFDLCAGFTYSQTLLACVRLGLFDLLSRDNLDTAAVAKRTGLIPDAAERLLLAAEALGLVGRRSGGRWGLGPIGAPMAGNDALAAMVEHNALLYDDLSDPVALLRRESGQSRLERYWDYGTSPTLRSPPQAPFSPAPPSPPIEAPAARDTVSAEAAEAYSTLMARSVGLVADEVLARYPVRDHRVLLDVAGGEGAFLEAVARRAPNLGLILLELAPVAARAERRFAAAGLGGRVRVHAGNFLEAPLPNGADLITLVRVLHDHDDETVAALLAACHSALPPNGKLLIAEPMSGEPEAPTSGAVYFGWYLFAMGRGRARLAAEYRTLLQQAGFVEVMTLPSTVPLQTGIVVARRL